MGRDVVIFGIGEGSRMAFRLLREDSDHRIAGFVVDDEHVPDGPVEGLDVLPMSRVSQALPPAETCAFVPLGFQRMNALRRQKYEALKALGYDFISYAHSSNDFPAGTTVGENCFILERQVVNHGVSIGDNVVIWGGSHIGDRSHVGSHCWLSAHVCINGDISVGEESFLGSNCTVSHGVAIGARSFIGSNALITKDTDDGAVHIVEGTPALGVDSRRFIRLVAGG